MHISPEYLALQKQFHLDRPEYGSYGGRLGGQVAALANAHGCTSVLDYGCGKGTLAQTLVGVEVREYDPAIPGKDAAPEPADLVVCTDVLEHIELEHVEPTLVTLRALTRKVCLVGVHTGLARKRLPDGRNAHITIRPARWWIDKFWEAGFDMRHFNADPLGFLAVLVRYGE